EQDIIIIIKSNKPCWVQVYQCDGINEKREPLWGWDSFRDQIKLYPKRNDPPQDEVFRRLARKDIALKIPLTLESESLEFIAVAFVVNPPTKLPPGIKAKGDLIISSDSLGWIASTIEDRHGAIEWAIDGWSPPESR
ncbi:MAG: hypothetical protein QXI19_07400, partial [Candidatus Caldarchaeum sp.]